MISDIEDELVLAIQWRVTFCPITIISFVKIEDTSKTDEAEICHNC
jgi:hypothetical protein